MSKRNNHNRGDELAAQFWTRVQTSDTPYKGHFFTLEELQGNEPEGGLLEEGWLTIDRALANYEALAQ